MLAAAAVFAAVLLQVTFLDRLSFPGGAGPDLVLVVVVTLALVSGAVPGMLIGFAAGLALDVAPPAGHLIGQGALVFCLVGYACGRMREPMERSAWLPLAGVAVGVVGGESLYALTGLVFGDPDITWASARQVVPAAVVYELLLSPFVLYAVVRLGRYQGWIAGQAPDRNLLAGADLARARLAAAGLAAGLAGGPGGFRDTGSGRGPRLASAPGRPGDGWIGSRSTGSGQPRAPWVRRARPLELRLRGGVAGSAAGGLPPRPPRPAAPLRLRLGAPRRHDGAIGEPPGAARTAAFSAGRRRTAGQVSPGSAREMRRGAFRGGAGAGLGGSRGAGGAPGSLSGGRPAQISGAAFRSGRSALRAPAAWRPRADGLRLRRRRGDGVIGGSVLGGKGPRGVGLASAGGGSSRFRGRGLRRGSFRGDGVLGGSVLGGKGSRGVGLASAGGGSSRFRGRGLRRGSFRGDGVLGGSVLGGKGSRGVGLASAGGGSSRFRGRGLRRGSFRGDGVVGGLGGSPAGGSRVGVGLGSVGLSGARGMPGAIGGGGNAGRLRLRGRRSGRLGRAFGKGRSGPGMLGGSGLPASAFLARRAPGGAGPLRSAHGTGANPRFGRRRSLFGWVGAGLARRRDPFDRLGRRGGLGGRRLGGRRRPRMGGSASGFRAGRRGGLSSGRRSGLGGPWGGGLGGRPGFGGRAWWRKRRTGGSA